jgi:hypothetical protein
MARECQHRRRGQEIQHGRRFGQNTRQEAHLAAHRGNASAPPGKLAYAAA